MKFFSILILIIASLEAFTYTAKVEAYESYAVSAEYDGEVLFTNKDKEFSDIEDNSVIVKQDTTLERVELESLKNSIKIQEEVLAIKNVNYLNKKKIKQLSIYEKNNEKLELLNAKQTVEDLKKQLSTLEYRIGKKTFRAKGRYLYTIDVAEGEYVGMGTQLYTLYNLSKLKLVVYVKLEELEKLKDAKILMDGKQTQFKVAKTAKVVDTNRISRYKVELYKENTNLEAIELGKVVEVEFRP